MASNQQISYIANRAQQFGLDPDAVLAIASHEGIGGGVGDNGTSFGPFQLHEGGALPGVVGAKGGQYAQQWAWSPEGIDYALNSMAKVARGLKGQAAVAAISERFERPADPAAEISDAMAHYGNVGGGGTPAGGTPQMGLAPQLAQQPSGAQHVVAQKVSVLGNSLATELLASASALTGGGSPNLSNLFTLAKGFQTARKQMGKTPPLGGTVLARAAGSNV